MQQEVHAAIGGDRRLRPHNHHHHNQSLKCPRCDSANTKFCYYNNYNLSQPRHFCKSCRRYWTKGGVLRNVPIGGGCRKSKRSKPPKIDRKSNANSSSSESSTLTAAEKSIKTTSDNAPAPYDFPDPSFFNVNRDDPYLNCEAVVNNQATDGQIFAAEIGSLIAPSDEVKMMEFGVATASFQTNDPTAGVDEFKMNGEMSNDGLAAVLDWGTGGGDQSLFDLTAEVDPSYWSQTQWTDNDQSLNYIP